MFRLKAEGYKTSRRAQIKPIEAPRRKSTAADKFNLFRTPVFTGVTTLRLFMKPSGVDYIVRKRGIFPDSWLWQNILAVNSLPVQIGF